MAPPGSVGPGAGRGARGTPGASPRGAGGRDTTEGTPRGLVSPSSPRRAGPGLSVAQRGPGLQLPSAPARGTPFPGALWRLGAAQRACVAAERRRRALRHLVPVPEQCERCGAGRSPVGDGDRREEPGAGSDDGNAGSSPQDLAVICHRDQEQAGPAVETNALTEGLCHPPVSPSLALRTAARCRPHARTPKPPVPDRGARAGRGGRGGSCSREGRCRRCLGLAVFPATPRSCALIGRGAGGLTTFQCAMEGGQRNGFCSSDGNVEEPLSPQDGGASPHPEVPGDTDKRMHRRFLGKLSMLHPAWVLVLAVLVVLALALAVALAVVSAGRCEGNAGLPVAQVLPCPNDWVGYRDVCYYLSREEGSWEWSQEQCSSHGASLAVLKRDWEVEFLLRLKGNIDYWLGLQRQGEHLQWVDGSSFNDTILVQGQEPCLFLKDDHLGSSSCSQHRPYLCSKPQL
ncbi:uncharacterized protein [Ciconia boyciana]|uniref:uncharacterized protein isoform X3 n=1 Tax=Ciconia boyciana TaxID=52775 RepID=UPI003B9FE347